MAQGADQMLHKHVLEGEMSKTLLKDLSMGGFSSDFVLSESRSNAPLPPLRSGAFLKNPSLKTLI